MPSPARPPRSAQRRSGWSSVSTISPPPVTRAEPVAAGERPDAAAEQEADDADHAGGAGDRRQPVLGRRRDDVAPLGAAADRREPRARVDADVAEALGRHHHAGLDLGLAMA